MADKIALFGIPGSGLAREVAANLSGTLFTPAILSIDAPLEGKPVTFSPGSLVWEGVDLFGASAIFAECSVFCWPQALLPWEKSNPGLSHKDWVVFQREARSLVVSSLWAAGRVRPMINPPSAAHFAMSPSIALDDLAHEGIPVHPYSVEPAPEEGKAGMKLVLDVCGRERWHVPGRPPAGETALVLEPCDGEVVTFFVADGAAVGALRYARSSSWAARQTGGDVSSSEAPEPLSDLGPDGGAAELAKRATKALGLAFAAVSIRGGGPEPAVIYVEASPDLESWNAIFPGRVARSLAESLVKAASSADKIQK